MPVHRKNNKVYQRDCCFLPHDQLQIGCTNKMILYNSFTADVSISSLLILTDTVEIYFKEVHKDFLITLYEYKTTNLVTLIYRFVKKICSD